MNNFLKPMKTIDMSTRTSAKAYLTRNPEDTHSKDELESLHNAIHFTQTFMKKESLAKMDEEELIARPIPRI